MDEDEEQRETDGTSCILLGMPRKTAYKMMSTEYRNCRGKVITGE